MIGIQWNMINLTAKVILRNAYGIWEEAPTIQAAEGAQTNSVQVKSKTYNDLNNNLEDCM